MNNRRNKREYPDNLLAEILGNDYENKICNNVEESLMYIYENILTERQQAIVSLRFMGKKSLTEVSRNLGFSKEAIRCSEEKLIQLYRRPYILAIITEGIIEATRQHNKKIDIAINYQKEIEKTKHSNPKELPLYYLNLPLKTFNFFIKELSYICTPSNLKINHILRLGPEGLANIRRIGPTAYTDIVDEISNVGVNVQNFKKSKLYIHKK